MINELAVNPSILMNEVSLELSSVVTDTRKRMKAWLESEGYQIPENSVFEVGIRFNEEFGIEREPKWSVRLDSFAEYDALQGFGDTVEAALASFRKDVRERAHGNRLHAYLEKKDGLVPAPFVTCENPCNDGMEGCRCKLKGGKSEGV